jgi:Noc2p family
MSTWAASSEPLPIWTGAKVPRMSCQSSCAIPAVQVLELLAGSMALIARNPGYPEMAHLPMLALKSFVKSCPVDRFRSQAKLLLDAMENNARIVGVRRDAVDFAPKDMDKVDEFMRCVQFASAMQL